MPYGQAGRLGERIDPRLMQADYSGYANAGMIQGQALAGLGQQIGDAAKQRGQEEKFIKKSEKLAKDIGELIPELQGQAGQALEALNNPDLSHRDRLAMAESIGETLKIGMMGIENQRAKEMMALRRASMAAKGEAAPSATSIRAALDLMKASGYNKQAESLEKSLGEAKTPEEMAGVASLIQQMAGSMKYSSLGVEETGSMAYKISGTPAKVPKGDKMVSEWEVTAPDGSKFTVDAKQKQRLNKAIQSGKPFDLAEVLGEPSVLSKGAGFLQRLFSSDEYGTETPKPSRPTSLQERQEANRRLIELKKLAAQGDLNAANEAAALENALRQGGFMGEIKLTSPEQLLGNPFDSK